VTALWPAFLLASQLAAVEYRIAGEVVNAASGKPVAGARVTLAPIERRDQRMSTLSGHDGRFAFPGLPRGKYELAGQRRGLLSGTLPGAIVIGPDQNTESIVLRLSPPAILSGKVVDDAGEPVAQALVELLSSTIIDGRRQLSRHSVKRADDTGEYRFSSLAAGSYYIVVSGVPWYTRFNETMGDAAPRGMTHTGYGIRYYPNAADPAAAEPLILTAGQEAAANFALIPVPAASVSVHCAQCESLNTQYTLTTEGLQAKPVSVRQGSATGDLYNLWGILPGHYTLRAEATDGSRTWYGASELDVAAGDMDAAITLHPAPSVSGEVVVESGASLPAQLTVVLQDENGRSQPLGMGPGGRFSIPAIPPGRYRVGFSGASGYYLKNWSAEGGRRAGEMLDIPAGAVVQLTLSAIRAAGRVTGTVFCEGQPLAGALVVLTPENRAVGSNSDGSFEFRGLPVGEYQVFAVEEVADLEYANPAAIRPYLAGAKEVSVAPGGAADVRLDIGQRSPQQVEPQSRDDVVNFKAAATRSAPLQKR
jgi:hypothetical protein